MPPERPSVRLGSWTPPTQYNQPVLEPDGDIRTKEHEVLADVTVVQNLGENAETYTLRGDCFADDLRTLRDMRGETVGLRHPIHSGDVLVRRVTGKSTNSWESDGWVYTYTIELTEVV